MPLQENTPLQGHESQIDSELEHRVALWENIDRILHERNPERLKEMLKDDISHRENIEYEDVAFAVSFMEEAHRNQKRNLTGDPYSIHPLQVALIGMKIIDPEQLTADHINDMLLHDVLEETSIPKEVLEGTFGENTKIAVQGLSHTENGGPKLTNAEYINKLFRVHNEQPELLLLHKKTADFIANGNDPVKVAELRDPLINFPVWDGIVKKKIGEMFEFRERIGTHDANLFQVLGEAMIYTHLSKEKDFSVHTLKSHFAKLRS